MSAPTDTAVKPERSRLSMTQHVLPQGPANTLASQSPNSSAPALDVKSLVHTEPTVGLLKATGSEHVLAQLLKLAVDLGDGMRTLRTLVPQIEMLYSTETALMVDLHLLYFSYETTEAEARKVFRLAYLAARRERQI
jgi:predicted nucleotidyltransferase